MGMADIGRPLVFFFCKVSADWWKQVDDDHYLSDCDNQDAMFVVAALRMAASLEHAGDREMQALALDEARGLKRCNGAD
jgi:hypothetical protein